jgi:hypothetical protein
MPIYKGKDITIEEWYEINPAARPKPPMTEEERAEKRKKEALTNLVATIDDFGDALEIGDYIYAANNKGGIDVYEGIRSGAEARKVVDAYRMLAQLIFERNNIPADTWYEGSADDMYMEEETCDNSINIPGANDDPTLC